MYECRGEFDQPKDATKRTPLIVTARGERDPRIGPAAGEYAVGDGVRGAVPPPGRPAFGAGAGGLRRACALAMVPRHPKPP